MILTFKCLSWNRLTVYNWLTINKAQWKYLHHESDGTGKDSRGNWVVTLVKKIPDTYSLPKGCKRVCERGEK
jgi:hypothetical protein